MILVKEAWRKIDTGMYDKDFYLPLTPVTWFCRIVGIFPLKLKGPVGKRKYSTSYAAILHALAVLIFTITALSTLTDNTNQRSKKLSNHPVVIVSIYFELILEVSSMAVMVIAAIAFKNKFTNIMHSLSLQDKLLRQLGTRIDYAMEYKHNCIKMGIVISIMMALCTFDFIYQIEFNLSHVLNWIAWMCPNIIRLASACLFVEIVLVLKQRFAALNEHLIKMIEESKYPPLEVTSSPDRVTEKIHSIAMMHGVLCESALNINQAFGLNIIAGVVYALIILTTTMYYVFRDIKDTDRSYWQLFGTVNWGMMSCIHLIYIVTACHLAQNAAHSTGKIIHKFEIHRIESTLTNVIQSFSLQLHHEKIKFSGAGLFPLDATLIQSIVGAVTTYLVIIIQFDVSMTPTMNLQDKNISFT